MADPFYSWHIGTLVDGLITTDIPIVNGSWQSVMDDAGTLTVTVQVSDPDIAGKNLYVSAEPCRCFLAVAYTDSTGTETFLEGGPIWTHSYDSATKQLTVSAAGLWSYYDHRKVLPVLAAGVNPATVTSSFTTSLGTIAKQLVQLAHTHTGGAVPVVFPADVAGTDSRAYAGFDMQNVGQALRDLAAVTGGPEIQFVPQRSTSDARYLQWVMRVGTTAQPLLQQAGSPWAWDQSAAKSALTKVTVSRDGSPMADRYWSQGSGTDISTMFGRADNTNLITAGFPLLELADNHSDIAVQSVLSSLAAGGLAQSQRANETWSITVNRDAAPHVGTYRVGDQVALTVGGLNDDGTLKEPYLPNGTYSMRVTSISGDDSTEVAVALAASKAA